MHNNTKHDNIVLRVFFWRFNNCNNIIVVYNSYVRISNVWHVALGYAQIKFSLVYNDVNSVIPFAIYFVLYQT